MAQQLSGLNAHKSGLARLGLGSEPGRAAPYLRAILKGLKEGAAEELKKLPGGTIAAGVIESLLDLSEEEDDHKLEQRIENLLAIGEQTQDEIAALTTLSAAIFVRQEVLVEKLSAAGFSAERERLTEFAMGAALIAYRSRVAREYQYADHRGIRGGMRADHVAALPLDDVYVMPRLLADRERADGREREDRLLKELLDQRDAAREDQLRLEEEYAVLTGKRWQPDAKAEKTSTFAGEALKHAQHAVVIGNPGVGKSALTRYLARICALSEDVIRERLGWDKDVTPIVLALASFADARRIKPNLALRAFLEHKMIERGGEALWAAIAQELSAGALFVLLDGVDEVPDFAERSGIVLAVEDFIRDHAANRFLITSRPYGYIPMAGEITHFQMPNFAPQQVEDFISQWQRAFERWQRPDAPDLALADREADETLLEIRRDPKVAELATNPLMLVIITIIRHEQTRLPQERVRLYDCAVNTLMETWNYWRAKVAGLDTNSRQLPVGQLIEVWAAVAEWTRRTIPTGVIHRAQLKRKLVEILTEKELDEGHPEATAEAYLEAAANRAGLLEERGPDIFAFWHPTFEEFLAAVALTTPTGRAIKNLLPLRDDPRWREVILLAIGYVGIVQRDRDTATDIVQAIADQDHTPIEPLLHPHLRLAAACVADNAGVKPALMQQIIARLAEVICSQPYEPLTASFVTTIRALPRLRPTPETVSSLTPLTRLQDWKVRMEIARLFSNVAVDNATARELCGKLLEDRDPDVRCHAALGLARTGDLRPEVWRALAGFQSSLARVAPAVSEFLATASSAAVEALRSCLTAEDTALRFDAASLLQQIGRADEQAVEALRPYLTADDPELRFGAASLLQEMERADEQTVQALLPYLTADVPELRFHAASLLQQIGRADEQAVEALRACLTADDSILHVRAASLLKEMGRSDEIVETLRPCLTADDPNLRVRAARLLQQVGRTDEQAVEALRECLTDDDPKLRFRVASLLRAMRRTDEQTVEALRLYLTADDRELCFRAASLLQEMGRADKQAVEALRTCLTADDPKLCFRAARLLQEMGHADEQAVEALRACLIDDDHDVRWGAASLLPEMGRADEQAVEALQAWLTADDSDLRFRAASLLRLMGRADEQAVETIAKIAEAQPWAALAACQRVINQQPLADSDGSALAELVLIRNDDSDERRWAREWLFDWLRQKLEPEERTAG